MLGATNNDVILTIVSGALHRWHTSRGADVKELRVLTPVSLLERRRMGLVATGSRCSLVEPAHRGSRYPIRGACG